MPARWIRRAGGLLVGALVVAGVAPWTAPATAAPAPAADPAPGSVLVGCDQASTRVEVAVSSHLDPSCTYTGGIDVVASDVVLDCQGALLQSTGGGTGILVRTPVDVDLSGVTVRNCRVDGFLNSIRVTRDGFRALAPGDEYTHHLSDVLIEDNVLSDSRGVGIFLDGYTSRVTVRGNTVTGAGSSGIYLEAGSREHVVEDNVVHDNGYRENGPDGQTFELAGLTFRFWGIGREGLSIDGSYDNRVVGNSFSGNSAGGIFLYTNCGEFVNERPNRWFERRFGAERNLVEGNTFEGGINGIWVGSRMGENTYPMDCSDPAYLASGIQRVVLDRAAHNTIRANTFTDVTYGIRVEDDGTTVTDNQFTGPDATHHAIVVGTRHRTEVLDHPVRDTIVSGNRASITGNPFPYRWIHGTEHLVATGNTASGRAVGLCRGEPLPHTELIFVLAFVLEDPNGPPTPKPPGLEMPTVGALAPCPTLVPGAATVTEGDAGTTTVSIPVTMAAPSLDPVRASWSTLDLADSWLATPGADFTAASGTIELAPGQTATTIDITVHGDALDEDDEHVLAALTDPAGAAVGGFFGLGFGAIVDDDPLPRLVPGLASVIEGNDGTTTVSIPVTLSAASGRTVWATWSTLDLADAWLATPGADFTAASGTIELAPGQTATTIDITVHGDALDEDDEHVLVALTDATNAAVGGFFGLGFGAIVDDDGLS